MAYIPLKDLELGEYNNTPDYPDAPSSYRSAFLSKGPTSAPDQQYCHCQQQQEQQKSDFFSIVEVFIEITEDFF